METNKTSLTSLFNTGKSGPLGRTLSFRPVVLALSLAALAGCISENEFDPLDNNVAPVCDAGPDFSGLHHAENVVDGSGTYDPNGDELSYQWTVLEAPINSAHYDFEGDTEELFVLTPGGRGFGDYVLQLEASDGEFKCRDEVVVSIEDRPVTCELGSDFTATVPWADRVFIEGFAGDPDGNPIDWGWSIVDGPVDHIAWMHAHNSPGGSLLIPGHSVDWRDGEYRIRLETWIEGTTFSEGSLDSCSDEVTVTVEWINSPPVADAGADITAVVGQVVTLDASGSYDVDEDVLDFNWGARGQPADSRCCVSPHPVNDLTPNPNFIPDVPGDFTFAVFITDGEFRDSDDVVVHVIEAGQEGLLPNPELPADPHNEILPEAGESKSGDSNGEKSDQGELDDPVVVDNENDVADDSENDAGWDLGSCLLPWTGLANLPDLDQYLDPLAECMCDNADEPMFLECQAEEADLVRVESRTHMDSTRDALSPAWNHGEQGAAQLEKCGTMQRAADQAHEDALALDRDTSMFSLTGQLTVQRAYGRAIGLYTAMRICLVDKF